MKRVSWLHKGSGSRHFAVVALAVLAVALVVPACLSTNNRSQPENAKRTPSSELEGVYDKFSEKGYEEATHRQMQEGRTLSREQIVNEMAGREIWYKSAPNGRFHTYVFGQRVNAPIDWYRVLRTDQRWQRFNIWGVMNDPDCCTPGRDCDQKGAKFKGRSVTLQDTYGLDYCPGDEELLGYVGAEDSDYRKVDPACSNPAVKAADILDKNPRENACELAFGTSTGAVGFRKFPNPRFNAARWKKMNEAELAKKGQRWDGTSWDGLTLREVEGSVEPPFRVAISCASCHVSFDPSRPPRDLNHPEWNNLSGTVGNQYIQISEILGSGTRPDSLEQQLFIPMGRAGATDTSAVPNDTVGNPGTINAVINIPQRPQFTDKVSRWFHVPSCDPKKGDCQEVNYKTGQKKYWQWDTKDMKVFHILKGGEDSVGADLAVQRVYVNIGMCAEQCWMNHHMDLRALNPHDRGFGQTPFNIAQCRRDCAPWRANEDRVTDIVQFLLSARPTDLKQGLKNTSKISADSPEELDAKFQDFLEGRYGAGSVARGRDIFAKNCASCHSSQNQNKADLTPTAEDFTSVDFAKEVTLPSGEVIRADWMGNEKSTSASEIGTYRCRAHHTNHMKGHLWEQFASNSYWNKPATSRDPKGKPIAGGPGYYRNISLINVWAFAPFLHNNAVGPEVCGRPEGAGLEVHSNTYEGEQIDPKTKRTCDMKFDASIEGRLKVYEASMDELLTEESKRKKKITRADVPIRLPLGMSLKSLGQPARKFYLEFPAGTPIATIGNLDLKGLVADIMGSLKHIDNEAEYNKYWNEQAGVGGAEMAAAVKGTLALFKNIKDVQAINGVITELQASIRENSNERLKTYMKYYSNCLASYENVGHNIGVNLPQQDKNALKAFLATF